MHLDEKILKDLEKNIAEYSDEEIIEILKKRKHYNSSVVKMTISEAVKRELINSQDDLLAEDFRVEPLKFSLFPKIEKPETKQKIIKSLSRAILLAGIIPTIFGFLHVAENKMIEAFIFICLGGVWIISAAFLMKTYQIKFINIIMVLGALSIIYVVNTLFQLKSFQFMDLFVSIIMFGIVYYSLLYIKFLIKDVPEKSK